MKPQVFTTIASARSWSETSSSPLWASVPSIFSLSTRFFGQPRLTNATELMVEVSSLMR